ncbi:CPBP family intramembrane metalloprotease [Natronomonas gomsonensis]|jgi:membrane protease YdiL (CAAX protease family)|uniref:CPBP family intramembrane glutamic endopeptidase n=1 Tax=Natronomonas gomsonensis TaxID=1046043 RepID=UPI0020CA531F|nr:type II CAAX endopeptidase family protein [Natronomonas gomsonensis]MCY4730216.1 CPBP family intramembrane metalloprotease [Natronomonas gomsonensis]
MAPLDSSSGPIDAVAGRIPSPVLALLTALLLAVVGLGGGSLIGLAVAEALGSAGIDLPLVASTVLSTVLLQGLTFFGLSAFYLRYRGFDLEYVGVRTPDLEGWIYVGAGYVLAFVTAITMIFVVVFLLGLTPAQNRAGELGQQDPRIFLVLIVLAFVLIGPGEELLFRGIIQSRLRETFSAPVGLALATAIFAAAHAGSLSGPTSGVALTITLLFFPGLVFAITYEMTDNVVVPAIIHGLYNATLFALAYISTVAG